jgi:8-oxo-dGTP pyrophosphatase MutT (NUDIX family)
MASSKPAPLASCPTISYPCAVSTLLSKLRTAVASSTIKIFVPFTSTPAATVLLLRDGANGLEVLMTRRSMTASFAPGAYVFPGGGIDALDAASHGQAARRPSQSDVHLTQAIAAIRESFEELGVLLARRPAPAKG